MAKAKPSQKKKTAKKRSTRAIGEQRLNKILAAAGLGSRREVEELIVQGRVEVNREIVTDLASKFDPSAVTIKVDGEFLKQAKPVYFALNKPKGVLSTNRDPSGRMRVIDLIPEGSRVFSVGRLDRNSEGLMLLTNDGELAQRLAHPKFRIQKSYFVVVAGQLEQEELDKLRKGVYLAEGLARIDGAKIKRHRKGCTEIEIVLSEGKNREIRRILARAGHKVVLLRRIAIGSLKLGLLPVGGSRPLTRQEVNKLYTITEPSKPTKTKKQTAKKKASKPPKQLERQAAAPEEEFSIPDFDEFDDDFVGDFSGIGTIGSVLAYDGESEPAEQKNSSSRTKKSARSSSRGTGAQSKRAAGKRSTRKQAGKTATGSRTSSKSKTATPAKRSTKTATKKASRTSPKSKATTARATKSRSTKARSQGSKPTRSKASKPKSSRRGRR